MRVTPALPPEVRRRLTVHTLELVARYLACGMIACAGLMVCVWPDADHARLLLWLVASELCLLLSILIAVAGLKVRRPDAPAHAERLLAVTLGSQGLLLGGLPVLVPAAGHTDALALWFTLLAVAFAAAFAVIMGGSLVLFGAYQVTTLTSAAAVTFAGLTGLPPMLGCLELFLLLVLVLGRSEQIVAVRRATVNELRAERLAADLAVERDRGVAANARLAASNGRLEGANRALAHAAGHDGLTGLANRVQFLDRLDAALAEASAHGRRMAVLFFDLDRFKVVNDSSGHATGDELLRLVAERTAGVVRGGDLVARHAGDEFTVLLAAVADPDDAIVAAERIRSTLADPFEIDGQRIDISASIGIAMNTVGTDTAEDLMRHADSALYRAKDLGRDRIELFDESMRDAVRRRLHDEIELRDALRSGLIVPWFQPVVDMVTGQVIGGEALARWLHPEEGPLPPARFLPLMLDSGLGPTLGRTITAETLKLRARLADVVPESFQLAINVAARGVPVEAVVDEVAGAAGRLGVTTTGITLEITETVVITDLAAASAGLARARDLGMRVALDDFGTGYSALSLLRDLPLDTIKIDRGFVRGMAGNPADAAVVAAVLQLADRLGLGVVAEGVEDADDVARLLAAGARLAQGYRYSPAVPADVFEGWLRSVAPWLDHSDAVRAGRRS